MLRAAYLFGAILCVAACASADVRLPSVIGDNMVLQADAKLTVWGKAAAGENVTVQIADQKVSAIADGAGKWSVAIKPLKASDTPIEMTVSGKNEIKVKNVLVGQVWLASGQSNMEMKVSACSTAKETADEGDLPLIRVFTAPRTRVPEPADNVGGSWIVCTPKTVGNFTGTGFYFAGELHKALKQPVGIVCSAVGGTPIEQWTPYEVCDSNVVPLTQTRVRSTTDGYDKQVQDYEQNLSKWRAATQAVIATRPALASQPNALGAAPRAPVPAKEAFGGLYNGMIAPVSKYTFKGAIWYQGEANASQANEYKAVLPAMISAWRKATENPDMPFLIVQLPNFKVRRDDPNARSEWAELREAQAAALNGKNVGVAVTIDAGEANNIHPRDKVTVGKRLALLALAKAYGKEVAAEAPIIDSMKLEGASIRVKFRNAAGGLVAKGGGEVTGFALAGSDATYYWAKAKIDGDSVIVSCEKVDKPASVRYAWGDNPECNLYNKADLPAMPFRAEQSKEVPTPPAK